MALLTSSGYFFTWDKVKYGTLGHGSTSSLQCLTIPCLVEGLRQHKVVQISTNYEHCAVSVDPTPSTIRHSQQALFNNEERYDVVLMVENEPIYAIGDVLSQKSDYFAVMFRSNMRESYGKIPDCSKILFLLMLEYLCLDGFVGNRIYDNYKIEAIKL